MGAGAVFGASIRDSFNTHRVDNQEASYEERVSGFYFLLLAMPAQLYSQPLGMLLSLHSSISKGIIPANVFDAKGLSRLLGYG